MPNVLVAKAQKVKVTQTITNLPKIRGEIKNAETEKMQRDTKERKMTDRDILLRD
jgi:hypothetical protein